MQIGEAARRVGISPDTVRFYERAGALVRPGRRDNRYRDYSEADVEHLRLLVELRRLDVPLDDAARVAGWCHAGHCGTATGALPSLIRERRADVAARIRALAALDARLAELETHLDNRHRLPVLAGDACCQAADAVLGACCAVSPGS